MPVVDLATGKIIGCKKGSLTYYHEKAHIKFVTTYKGILYGYCSDAYLKFGFVILILNNLINLLFDNDLVYILLNIFLLALVLSIVYFYFYEEIWCWLEARKERGKYGRRN